MMLMMNGFLVVFVVTLTISSRATTVLGEGLREEFTWTRLSYYKFPFTTRFDGALPLQDEQQHNSKYQPKPPHKDMIFFPQNDQPATTPTATPQAPTITEDYIYENNIPMGANRWGNKLFVTVPRRRLGVPSTLNYVWANSTERHNLPLIPYPKYQPDQLSAPATPDRLVSVYRVAVDPCDRLWMVDTGIIEIPGNRTDIQPQRIVIIDLNTDKIIKTYEFKSTDLTSRTILALVNLDVTPDKCDEAYAYLPDLAGFGLVVYSLKDDDSWRVKHNYFYLEPLRGDFHVGGVRFQWTDGIFSTAVSEVKPDGFRDLYFHSMAGTNLYRVSTRVLRDKELATRSYHEKDFESLGDRGQGWQTSATDLHKPTGVLFMALVNRNAIGCWNTKKPFAPENFGIVHKDDDKMIYPADLKISGDDVIALSNTMPVFLYAKLDYDQTNFRVWINNVYDAVKGTPCNVD